VKEYRISKFLVAESLRIIDEKVYESVDLQEQKFLKNLPCNPRQQKLKNGGKNE